MLEFVIRVRVQPSTFDATTKNTIEAFLAGGHLGAQLAIGSVETLKDAWGTGDDVKAANLLEVFTFASLFQSLSAVEEGAVSDDQKTAWVDRMFNMFWGSDAEQNDIASDQDGNLRWWYLRLNEQFKQGSWLTYANLLALTACALCGVPEAHETLTALWRRILKGEITFPVKTLVDALGPDWHAGTPTAIPTWIDIVDATALHTVLAESARAAREYMEDSPQS